MRAQGDLHRSTGDTGAFLDSRAEDGVLQLVPSVVTQGALRSLGFVLGAQPLANTPDYAGSEP